VCDRSKESFPLCCVAGAVPDDVGDGLGVDAAVWAVGGFVQSQQVM
jgi:hypothetical protein